MGATPAEQYDADGTESAQATQPEAVRLDPGNATYHDDLGLALYDQERYEEAEAAYREAIRLDPGNARFYDVLGAALSGQDKYLESERAYWEAIQLDPGIAATRPRRPPSRWTSDGDAGGPMGG